MKKLIMAMLVVAAAPVAAQDNTWEQEQQAAVNPDAKYLAGAVPVVDGKVTFTTTIQAPGKTKAQIFDIVHNYMTKLTREPNQFEQSRIAISDSVNFKIIGNYQEWLVFKATALVLDRTRLLYNLVADCEDGKVTLTMTRIVYLYEEERDPQTLKAEEWIDDENGLNRKKTKLARVSGKFRRKTIDRKDFLFNKFAELLK